MTHPLLPAAEAALEQLKILHMLSGFGECESPHNCPAWCAINDLEIAIAEEKITPAASDFREIARCLSHCEGANVFWNRVPLFPCNDCFFWGCSDAEEVLAVDVPEIIRAYDECVAFGDNDNGPLLFIARKRGMRPQGALYPYLKRETWPLFDACGPERPSDFGNPVGSDQIEEYTAKKLAKTATA